MNFSEILGNFRKFKERLLNNKAEQARAISVNSVPDLALDRECSKNSKWPPKKHKTRAINVGLTVLFIL